MRRHGWLAPALALLAVTAVLASSACSGSSGSDSAAGDEGPFAGCDALKAAPPSAAPASAGSPAVTLPDLRLPCFAGGEQIALRDLRGPAVINLWASWCDPCRTELPVMQRLADRADGRLTVLGVDTGDSREAGASFATAAGVTMPTLFDGDRELLNKVGRISLPVTIFVDSAGRSYVHPLPLDARSLATQVRTHTGVTVTP